MLESNSSSRGQANLPGDSGHTVQTVRLICPATAATRSKLHYMFLRSRS